MESSESALAAFCQGEGRERRKERKRGKSRQGVRRVRRAGIEADRGWMSITDLLPTLLGPDPLIVIELGSGEGLLLRDLSKGKIGEVR
jgi:hypothetical protein